MFSWVPTILYLTMETRELDLLKLLKCSKFQLALFLQVGQFPRLSFVNKLIVTVHVNMYLASISVGNRLYTWKKVRPLGYLGLLKNWYLHATIYLRVDLVLLLMFLQVFGRWLMILPEKFKCVGLLFLYLLGSGSRKLNYFNYVRELFSYSCELSSNNKNKNNLR